MSEWIETAKRKPTREDADEYGCVLWRNTGGQTNAYVWDSVYPWVFWMPIPPPPTTKDAVEETRRELTSTFLHHIDVARIEALIDAKIAQAMEQHTVGHK